tara:strand:- start:722 stop:874 length:153 start_codon:yes stop_codon:yes gene_type:complete
MTRKHFEAIAHILKMHKANSKLIMDFANECDKHNDHFDLHRFLSASGYYD